MVAWYIRDNRKQSRKTLQKTKVCLELEQYARYGLEQGLNLDKTFWNLKAIFSFR